MRTRAIKTEEDRRQAIRWIEHHKLPMTIQVTEGLPRSIHQNSLQFKWLQEAEQQGDMTAEEYRGYCKLTIGVPILRAGNDLFREKYDELIKPLPYETKIQMMMEPIDFSVTRLMDTKMFAAYLDRMYQHFRGLGFILTEPGP